MDDSQITGSTSSYSRKYALNGLFCIDDTKDSDATNKHESSDYKFGNGDTLPWVTDDQVKAMVNVLPAQKDVVIASLVKYKWSKQRKELIIKELDNVK